MVATILFIAIVSIEIFLILRSDSKCVVRFGENVFGEGIERFTPNGFRFCAYTALPYALPPIGNYRFEPPKPIPFWKGKKRFTEEANICVQLSYEMRKVVGNENCLFLNVYTLINRNESNNENDPLMPVMVWIHGGSYNVGSAGSDTNGPDYIVEKGIVVVTINFRLGPLGFLSWPSENIMANNGLHDQSLAMQWVHDNIKNFGGNSEKITLIGWSSGGASVSFHLYANKSKKLFHKAILMSGTMLNPWAFQSATSIIKCTYELLKKFNIQNCTGAIDILRDVDAYDLIKSSYADDMIITYLGSPNFCFIPTSDDEFAKHSPDIISQSKPITEVPLVIGLTSLEQELTHTSFEMNNIEFPNKNHTIPEIINTYLIDFFGHDSDITEKERFKQSFQRTADISYGIHKFIKCYTNVTKQKKVFLYRFAFDGKFGHFKGNSGTAGAIHGDDLGYLFKDFLYQNTTQYNKMNLKSEMLTRERMVTMWTNFIKFGNPTPNSTEFSNITWPSFNNDNKLFLNIDANITIEQLHDDDDGAYQLWNSIYQCLYNVQCGPINEYLYYNKSIVL